MSSFFCSNIQAIINSVGLVLDIFGAGCVAFEVLNQFKGELTEVTVDNWKETKIEKTKDYLKWEKKKQMIMTLGLLLLFLGFVLQILSNWILKFDSVLGFLCFHPLNNSF